MDPITPYVALYGSISGDWREQTTLALDAAGIAWFDPTDDGWRGIDGDNGDARQADVDALVARAQRALDGAACVVFHLARRRVVAGRDTGETTLALAARLELGYLAGRGIRSFVHIEPDVDGRNYLWAYTALYSAHLTRCASLTDATTQAIALMQAR